LAAAAIFLAACTGGSGEVTVEGASHPAVQTTVNRAPARLLGPLLSNFETSTTTLGRDGGISVPLPNGKAFWLFGDTPIFSYQETSWNMTYFIEGSSAGLVRYRPGEPITERVSELVPGRRAGREAPPGQFLNRPVVYMPDGTGRLCNKANGGETTEAARWATGAALLSDEANILITYIDVCVLSEQEFTVQGWGFSLYDWRANDFTVAARDVFPPRKDGSALPRAKFFGSPIITGDNVTLFSATCCQPDSTMFTTTMPSDVASLSDPDSYVPRPVLGMRSTLVLHVAPKSATLPYFAMYSLTGRDGEYNIYFADEPTGPWSLRATGILPRCRTSTQACTNSIFLHSELSSPSQLIVSYYLYGYGPAIAQYPDASRKVHHIVLAELPV
jgi:hypothetical protein